MDSAERQLLEKALEVAPECSSRAMVGRRVNDALGEDRSDAAWRGLWKKHPELAAKIDGLLYKARPAIRNGPKSEPFDMEKFFDLSLQAAEEWEKRTEKYDRLKLHIDTDAVIAMVNLSDLHVGSPGTAHRVLYRDIQTIAAHPHLYAAVGGDGINNFITSYLMWAGLNDVFAAGDQQIEVFVWLLSILAESGSLLYAGSGNHDAWTQQVANIDPRWHMFKDVPTFFVGQGGLIDLGVGEQMYRIYRRHRQRFSSVFNPAHAVKAEYERNPFDFDIGIIEHQHMSHGAEFDGKMREDGSTVRIAIRPGTYKLRDPYADERGFFYASHDLQCVLLWPDTFRMHRIRGLEETIEILDALNDQR